MVRYGLIIALAPVGLIGMLTTMSGSLDAIFDVSSCTLKELCPKRRNEFSIFLI